MRRKAIQSQKIIALRQNCAINTTIRQAHLFDRYAFPYKMVAIQPSVLIVLREGAKVKLAVTTA